MCRSVGKELIAELNTIRKQFADACKLSTESLELPDTDDEEVSDDDAIDSRSPTVDKTKTRSQKRKENEQTDDQNNGAEEKKKRDDKK